MFLLRIVIATVALASTTAAATEPIDIRATTGLPQVSVAEGEPVAWRYLSLRAGTRLFSVEARIPTCAVAHRALPSSPPALFGSTPGGCSGPNGDIVPGVASEQLKAKIRFAPTLAGGPDVDFIVRTWRSAQRSGFGPLARVGSSAEVALTQAIGSVNVFAGYSVPIVPTSPSNAWRAAFGGLEWQPVPRYTLELLVEQARAARTGERDRQVTLRYSYANGPNARFGVYLTRLADEPVERWRSGLGVEYAF